MVSEKDVKSRHVTRAHHLCKVWDESAVVTSKTDKATNPSDRCWYGPLHNCGNFIGINLYAVARDVMAKIKDFVLCPRTFVSIQNKMFSIECSKYLLDVVNVWLIIL
jgi:hypothetical protein